MPITFFMFIFLNIKLGTGKIYKLDKTNIYHVLLITLFGSVTFFIFIFSFGLFGQPSILSINIALGNLIGASLFIILLKVLTNILIFLKRL